MSCCGFLKTTQNIPAWETQVVPFGRTVGGQEYNLNNSPVSPVSSGAYSHLKILKWSTVLFIFIYAICILEKKNQDFCLA